MELTTRRIRFRLARLTLHTPVAYFALKRRETRNSISRRCRRNETLAVFMPLSPAAAFNGAQRRTAIARQKNVGKLVAKLARNVVARYEFGVGIRWRDRCVRTCVHCGCAKRNAKLRLPMDGIYIENRTDVAARPEKYRAETNACENHRLRKSVPRKSESEKLAKSTTSS